MFARFLCIAGLCLAGLAATGAARAQDMTVSGTVTYRERIALPPDAVLEVELLDVSRADAPSVRLSAQRWALGGVPASFALSYDPALIDDRMSYSVSARILLGDRVMFRTTSAYPVLTRDASDSVDIVLTRAAGPNPPALAGTEWTVVDLQGQQIDLDKPPAIAFTEDGNAALTSGCNRFSGPVRVEGDTIGFSDRMAGTMMACPPPYDGLEPAFLTALTHVARYAIDAGALVLMDDGGAPVMRLVPAQ